MENKIKLQLLRDWEATRYGQIKFITEGKEKQLTVAAENYKKDATRELRLKHEIESESKLIAFENFHEPSLNFQRSLKIRLNISKI